MSHEKFVRSSELPDLAMRAAELLVLATSYATRAGRNKDVFEMQDIARRIQGAIANLTDPTAQPQEAGEDAARREESLAMIIRMLVSSLKRHWPFAPQDGDLPSRAISLLRNYDLLGSPLRDDSDDGPTKQSDAARALGDGGGS